MYSIGTEHKLAYMESLGWRFLPYAPSEWGWRKFTKDGDQLAVEADKTWMEDLRDYEQA